VNGFVWWLVLVCSIGGVGVSICGSNSSGWRRNAIFCYWALGATFFYAVVFFDFGDWVRVAGAFLWLTAILSDLRADTADLKDEARALREQLTVLNAKLPSTDLERQEPVVSDLGAPNIDNQGCWICSACGERVEDQFTDCSKCGVPRPE
jgi:hypothetical protein